MGITLISLLKFLIIPKSKKEGKILKGILSIWIRTGIEIISLFVIKLIKPYSLPE